MLFISITRLKLRSTLKLLPFLIANEASVKSLKNSPGLIEAKELIDKGLTFWTLTVWDSKEAMMNFRNGIAHRNAMKKISDWCSEASYHHWEEIENLLPTWEIASDKLLIEGRITKLKNPSKNQTDASFPKIQWTKLNRTIKRRKLNLKP